MNEKSDVINNVENDEVGDGIQADDDEKYGS